MELTEAIAKFKEDLTSVKNSGNSQVEIDRLEKYLDQLLATASISTEHQRLIHQSNIAHYNATAAVNLENFRAVIDAGKEAINAAIIINGGAVIALMAFMGNVASKPGKQFIPFLTLPLLLFGLGALCGGFSFGTRYISQFFYAGQPNRKRIIAGHWFNAISWVVTLASLFCFAIGVFVSYQNLNHA